MARSIFLTLTLSSLLVGAGCASLPKTGEQAAPSLDSSRIAKLDHELERETDSDRISNLLFERGHAYLEGAESLRAARRDAGGTEYGTLILHALRDFEMVVGDFPDTAQAPEALFHLGAIYDYPNIASFGPALRYYQQTISDCPGTESALKARQAIRIIEDNVKQVTDGAHGGGG